MTENLSLLIRLKCGINFSLKIGILWYLVFDLALNLLQNVLQEVWENYSMKFHLVLMLLVSKWDLTLIEQLALIVSTVNKWWRWYDLNWRLDVWRDILSDLFIDYLGDKINKHVVYLRYLFVSECKQLSFISRDQVEKTSVLRLISKQSLNIFLDKVVKVFLMLSLFLLPFFLLFLL